MEVAVRLGRVRAWARARWELTTRQVAAAAAALDDAGARCLVLKGAHTGHLYPDRGARVVGDLDLLVPPERLRVAQDVLRDLGYRPHPGSRPGPEHRHLPTLVVEGGLPVELHRTLARRGADPPWVAAVWERAAPLPDGVALGMDPIDALLYTCKHLAVDHAFASANGVAGLADVRVLLAGGAGDPGEIAERARAWGVLPAVALCLHLARRLLGAEVPAELERAVRVEGVEEMAPRAVWSLLHVGRLGALRHLLLPTRATLNPAPPVSGLGGARPLAAARAWLVGAALPAVDDLRLDYPFLGRLAPLGYPAHWSRVAFRHAGLARLLRRSERGRAWRRMDDHERALRAWLG